tara:strand:+ start:298 stop:438 length:141 start_codon:yes stop_codon:yes gene_type:complete
MSSLTLWRRQGSALKTRKKSTAFWQNQKAFAYYSRARAELEIGALR